MAKQKTQFDIDEVNEILDLYKNKIRKEGNILTEYKCKSVSNFNEYLVEENVKRSNGEPFTLYKYNFWAGRHRSTGEYNYGKKIIMQRNEELQKQLSKEAKDLELQDIISIIDKNINDKNKVTALLCHYIKKQKDKMKIVIDENIKLSDDNRNLKNKISILEDTYTNLFFNSQVPNNSLNDMLSLEKSQDKFICEELENMFEDGLNRFNMLANLDYDYATANENHRLQNIINLEEKKKQNQRLKELEDEVF